MSATPTPAAPEGAEPPLGADPSMEDILASIRRILNEDETAAAPEAEPPAQPAAQAPAPVHAPPPEPPPAQPVTAAGFAGEDEDVLVLDEGMLVTPEPASPPITPVTSPAPPPPQPPPPAMAAVPQTEGLLAPESAAAAAAAVSSLLRTLSNERTAQVYRGGPTIEDLVREEIRPLLKTWLDQHLPPVVERLVRQEIERVAGRAGL